MLAGIVALWLGCLPFPEPQTAASEALLADILAPRAIPPERVVGNGPASPPVWAGCGIGLSPAPARGC